jgi:hypothetical protein
MANSKQSFSRRDAVKAGLGVAGALTLLTSGTASALAQPQAVPLMKDDDHHDAEQWASQIEAALGGTKGKFEDNGVFKVDLPRTDIQATIFGIAVKPDFALDTEVTFKRVGDQTAMKFEACLLDEEVNPVLSAWLDQHLKPELEQFTALHNHYLGDSPQIRFMHGFAVGDASKIARALYKALKENSGTPFGHGEEPPGDPGFDWKKVADILGGTGELMNGVLSVSVARKEDFRQRGVKLPTEMEFESVFNFQAIENGQVASNGEFVVLKDEADPVARELRQRKILVTALHSHELDVRPDVYYIHSWTTGDPIKVARDLRAALNHTNSDFK